MWVIPRKYYKWVLLLGMQYVVAAHNYIHKSEIERAIDYSFPPKCVFAFDNVFQPAPCFDQNISRIRCLNRCLKVLSNSLIGQGHGEIWGSMSLNEKSVYRCKTEQARVDHEQWLCKLLWVEPELSRAYFCWVNSSKRANLVGMRVQSRNGQRSCEYHMVDALRGACVLCRVISCL